VLLPLQEHSGGPEVLPNLFSGPLVKAGSWGSPTHHGFLPCISGAKPFSVTQLNNTVKFRAEHPKSY
jgi:hypothetical protein